MQNKATLTALQELVNSRYSAFPGAIGRVGTLLVRRGLARRLGRVTYAGTYRNGERPDCFVAFELTLKGQGVCDELGITCQLTQRR